jgi:hypothetical protein
MGIREMKKELAGIGLNGLVKEGPGDVVLVDGIDAEDLLSQWRRARSLVAVTGRWPVAVMLDYLSSGDDLFIGEPEAADLIELDRSARSEDPWKDISVWQVDSLEEAYAVTSVNGLDLRAQIAREMTFPAEEAAVDRWVYDRILADPAQRARELASAAGLTTTRNWFVPDSAALVLLPTTLPWLAPAWLSYFGDLEDDWGTAAALYQWNERWGAELVANWGTMLQLVTTRRPADGQEAWELAGQLKHLGGNLDMDQWELALALTAGDAWFLHDRP